MSEKQILVLNTGSSSLKLGLFDWDGQNQLDSKETDWGKADQTVQTHAEALEQLASHIQAKNLAAIGHRVVHGGSKYTHAVQIDDSVKASIKELAQLAPLHNPIALEVIEAAQQKWSNVPQVAAFDTAFHSTLAPVNYLYALPYDWYKKWGVRRFGFHGLSHEYCAKRASELLQPQAPLKLVTCHLGNGCSLAAIADGQSVATTMGFTPLEGLMMGSRSGSVDPGLLLYLLEHNFISREALDDALNHASGLKGVSGVGSDMREIQTAMAQGNQQATLAFEMYVARVREHIGAMVAALAGLDVLVFAGGVGEHSAQVRTAVCQDLEWLGIKIDPTANTSAQPDIDIATSTSKVRVLVIHTREELMVARQTRQLLENK